jgi:hypothetical protein
MKRSSSFAGFRWFLVLTLVIGVLLVSIFSLPFETIAGWLNALASDGKFESFTLERYQALSQLSGLLGPVLIVVSGLALIRWTHTQKMMERLGGQVRDFKEALRNDARVFLKGLSFSTWTRTELALMVGLVLVALITRLASLNIPLTHDEAYTYKAFASGSLWQTISDYHLPNNHIFLTIIINILTHLFGNHLWLIRLPTTVAGILMVPASYLLGRRLYSRETGILSAALVAVFPPLITYSVLARGYAFLHLFTLLIFIFGDQLREGKNRFVWILLIITNALGFFTIPIMLFPFGALYIWLFLSCMFGDIGEYRSRFDFFKYWLVSGLASALLTIVLYAPILINTPNLFFGNGFVTPLKKDVFLDIFGSRMLFILGEWVETIPVWIVIVVLLGFIAGLILHCRISRIKVPLQVAFFIWIAAILISRRPDMYTRMWLFLAAPFLIWSAGGMVETLKLFTIVLKKKLPLAQIFVGISVLSIFLLGAFTIPTIPARWEQKSSIESAALYLKDNLRDGDLVTANTAYFPQLRYYFDIYAVPQEYLRRSGPFERAFIVIGERGDERIESVAPRKNRNKYAVNMDTIKIVLQFDDLIVYEGAPAP